MLLALLPKIIVMFGSFCLFLGILFPSTTVISYMLFRPLIQPFAWLQYKLIGLPIAFSFSILVIAMGVFLTIVRRPWRLTVDRSGFFILFLIIAFSSIVVSDYFLLSTASLVKLLTVWFLCNIAYNSVNSEIDAVRIINALIISSIIPLLFGFFQAISGNYDIIYDAEVNRISSVFATGNDYGIFLSFITAAAAIRLVIAHTWRIRISIFVILSMIFVSQVLSLNRGTWLALTTGLIVAAWKYRRYLNFKILIFGVVIFMLLFSGTIIQRFQELKNPSNVHYSRTNTLEGRISYWRKLVPVILERPVLGYGIGSSSIITQKHFRKQNKLHNDYLLVSLEMGMVGLIAYVAFLSRIFLYFSFLQVKRGRWIWNYAMLMLSVYFIIISGVQNIVQSIINFPIFMILLSVVFKLNRIPLANEDTVGGEEMNNNSLGKKHVLGFRYPAGHNFA